jgi:hypothetical protein
MLSAGGAPVEGPALAAPTYGATRYTLHGGLAMACLARLTGPFAALYARDYQMKLWCRLAIASNRWNFQLMASSIQRGSRCVRQ